MIEWKRFEKEEFDPLIDYLVTDGVKVYIANYDSHPINKDYAWWERNDIGNRLDNITHYAEIDFP